MKLTSRSSGPALCEPVWAFSHAFRSFDCGWPVVSSSSWKQPELEMHQVNEVEVQQVMSQTGMDYIQARNHVRGRMLLRQRIERELTEKVSQVLRELGPKFNEGATS